jgi:hypothetical protein
MDDRSGAPVTYGPDALPHAPRTVQGQPELPPDAPPAHVVMPPEPGATPAPPPAPEDDLDYGAMVEEMGFTDVSPDALKAVFSPARATWMRLGMDQVEADDSLLTFGVLQGMASYQRDYEALAEGQTRLKADPLLQGATVHQAPALAGEALDRAVDELLMQYLPPDHRLGVKSAYRAQLESAAQELHQLRTANTALDAVKRERQRGSAERQDREHVERTAAELRTRPQWEQELALTDARERWKNAPTAEEKAARLRRLESVQRALFS